MVVGVIPTPHARESRNVFSLDKSQDSSIEELLAIESVRYKLKNGELLRTYLKGEGHAKKVF